MNSCNLLKTPILTFKIFKMLKVSNILNSTTLKLSDLKTLPKKSLPFSEQTSKNYMNVKFFKASF